MFPSYLERRIALLIKKIDENKLIFSEEVFNKEEGKKLIEDLTKIVKRPDGSIDISTATPLVRSFARSFYRINNLIIEDENKISPRPDVTLDEIIRLQRVYFNLLHEFFVSAFGKTPIKFSNGRHFSLAFQDYKNEKHAKQVFKAIYEYFPLIETFFKQHANKFLDAKKYLGGFNYVIGGSSRLPETAINGIRKYMLYSDTIYIPDPVLPWLEIDRIDSKFNRIRPIEECYNLLQLKPFIDADLPYPAIIVFPSWEKTLSLHDDATKDLISEFMLGFFSHHLRRSFEDENDIVEFISNEGKKLFRDTVIDRRLFIPPERQFPTTFDEAVDNYLRFIEEERSPEFVSMIKKWSPEILIFNGIMERLEPQFHVRDNAKMLNSHPLFWLEPHFYYFTLCSNVSNNELETFGIVSPETLNILQSLNSCRENWLGNIPIPALVELRKDNCNEVFRKKLHDHFNSLMNLNYEEIDRIGAEIGHAISSLLSEHNIEASKIVEKYQNKNLLTLGISVLTLGVQFFPCLSPHVGTLSTLGPLGKYLFDKYNFKNDMKIFQKSLFGVLSTAKNFENGITR